TVQAQAAALFAARREELRRLYASPLAPQAMRDAKRLAMRALAADLRALELQSGVPSGYGRWIEAGINNAELASVATYFGCVPGFERLLASVDHDLPRFYAAVKALAAQSAAARRSAVCTSPSAAE